MAQQDPAGRRDGEQAEGGYGCPAEGGSVHDEDHRDEQAAEGGPAHDVTRGVVVGVSGGTHGRVKGRAGRRGEVRGWVGVLAGPGGRRRLSWLDGVNRMTGHGVLPAGSYLLVGRMSQRPVVGLGHCANGWL
ncbi:hypothetical protein Snoj_59950 [Streptomyces nojiriensis]|uniref:Uncharacterized protein n=1 Tax=Streptomyces nojiriensis TaxID=66374 RepID=A0ABQ3SVY4_9ACTN|nr:hypothetical protein GCM10010205_27490 [Streptomyces nojiriensis]GHI72077.1 hypothetical protein Snoj_59950 [Streptomyces nojiriensis]